MYAFAVMNAETGMKDMTRLEHVIFNFNPDWFPDVHQIRRETVLGTCSYRPESDDIAAGRPHRIVPFPE